jgi:mannose-6-phosphate isomerase-like protein (cupin superfamily)
MRLQYFAIGLLATVMASSASAQQAAAPAAAPDTPPSVVFMSETDIMGLIEKAAADRKGDAPLVSKPILPLAPYRFSLEYRPGTSAASIHEKDAELLIVLQGTGEFVTGGKLVDEERSNASNLRGTSIADGDTQEVVKGDAMFVAAGVPHQIIPSGGEPIVLMTLHVPYPPTGWPPAK